MRAEGIFDVDANTSIDQLSEDLNIKMPEVYHFFYMLMSYLSSDDPTYLTGASVYSFPISIAIIKLFMNLLLRIIVAS